MHIAMLSPIKSEHLPGLGGHSRGHRTAPASLVTRLALSTMVCLWASTAIAGETLEALGDRMKIYEIGAALQNGDFAKLRGIPVKGYKDGLAGFMRAFELYPSPSHSFVTCAGDALATPSGPRGGCIVSVKLARKSVDGRFRDTGIRMEYGVAPGARAFTSNNSAYAEHAIRGDGALEAQFL